MFETGRRPTYFHRRHPGAFVVHFPLFFSPLNPG
jgi:hypothetical protein